MSRCWLPGTSSSTSTPMSGVNTTRLSTGRVMESSAHPDAVHEHHDRQPGRHAQAVVLDAAGLDPAQGATDALAHPAGAVDGAVDDPRVEPPQEIGDQDAAPREDELVEVVEVVLVEARPIHAGPEPQREALHEASRSLRLLDVPSVGQPDAGDPATGSGEQQQPSEADLEAVLLAVLDCLAQDRAGQHPGVRLLRGVEHLP